MKNAQIFSVGVDLGNGFTNYLSQATGEGQRFATKVEPLATAAMKSSLKEVHRIEIEGKRYLVGKGTSLEIKDVERRINSNEYKIALLTAIAKSLPRPGFAKINLCVGLPIANLESYADDLEAIIMGWKTNAERETIEFNVDGESYEIKIESAMVFPEGALSMIEDLGEGKVLTIDMGAGTVDCIEFIDGEPASTHTIKSSMNDIYAKIEGRLNSSEFKMTVTMDTIEEIAGSETYYYNREYVDISSHFEDIDFGVQEICNSIAAKFKGFEQYRRVILLGGASILTFDYWAKRVNGIELAKDAQYVNAKIFQLMAESA